LSYQTGLLKIIILLFLSIKYYHYTNINLK
jgi:hypothetical protein